MSRALCHLLIILLSSAYEFPLVYVLGKMKSTFHFFQACQIFPCAASSDFQFLTRASHYVMRAFVSTISLRLNSRNQNPVSISYHSALYCVFPAFTVAKQNFKCSAVSISIVLFSLSNQKDLRNFSSISVEF